MSVLVSILAGVAAKVGAPIVKGLLEKHLGGEASDIAGSVIDAIAEKAGVSPAELPDVPATQLEAAVVAVEAEAPELVLAWNEQQRLANALQLAEMEKAGEATWTWAWRPAWMWLLAFIWFYALVLRPIVNAAVGASIEAVDVSMLMTLTGMYLALYMGGNTAIRTVEKWKGGKA